MFGENEDTSAALARINRVYICKENCDACTFHLVEQELQTLTTEMTLNKLVKEAREKYNAMLTDYSNCISAKRLSSGQLKVEFKEKCEAAEETLWETKRRLATEFSAIRKDSEPPTPILIPSQADIQKISDFQAILKSQVDAIKTKLERIKETNDETMQDRSTNVG